MPGRHTRIRLLAGVAATLWVSAPGPTVRADEAGPGASGEAWAFLRTIEPSDDLQSFLDAAIADLREGDAALRRQTLRVSVIDLPPPASGRGPRLAQSSGDDPVYPASVVKLVYLMAAYAWQERGTLTIDADLDRTLTQMIHTSSNRATQRVVRRLTDTEAGPRLPPEAYAEFRQQRHRVKEWLADLGILDLHAVHPTYDGGGDIYGRDLQFLEDPDVPGALPERDGAFRNRLAMTADDTARLLALLATDRALSPESSAAAREHMRRDVREQGYLRKRIAGGARRADLEVFSKTGTWGPIFADAGIVRAASGHQLVVVVFVEGKPAYRGAFIAELTRRLVGRLLPEQRPRQSSRRTERSTS